MVTRVAQEINIPFTVGGGINELSDVERLLYAGADKVSINKDKFTDLDRTVGENDILDGKYILVQKGKKNYFIINVK